MTGVILQISVSDGGVPERAIARGIVWEEGVQGDRQADFRAHGGPTRAVCLYSLEVIEKLRAEGHPIGPGATGENVTVGALDWSLVPLLLRGGCGSRALDRRLALRTTVPAAGESRYPTG